MRLLILMLMSLMPVLLYSQPRQYYATRWNGDPPEIDGELDEREWSSVKWEDNFTQREPFEGEACK